MPMASHARLKTSTEWLALSSTPSTVTRPPNTTQPSPEHDPPNSGLISASLTTCSSSQTSVGSLHEAPTQGSSTCRSTTEYGPRTTHSGTPTSPETYGTASATGRKPTTPSPTETPKASSPPVDWELIRKIADAAPAASLDYSFSLYGYNEFNLKDEKLDLRKIPVDDDGANVEKVLPCMHNCTFLDMDSCGVGSDRMVEIRDAFPDVKVVWRIEFGAGMTYSLRTDATTCLASLSGGDWGQGPRDPEDVWGLQYCTDMKYLDLGHNNNLRTLFFCEYMPDLEVLILSRDHLRDLSPLANCKKLRYLELFWNPLDDITPLAGLENMTDLMISGLPNLTDMSCLVPADVMPKLNRLWVGTTTDVPHSQIEEFQKNHPNCVVNDTDNDVAYEWRYKEINHPESTGIPNVLWPQYEEIREIFGYDYNPMCYSFAKYDPYWLTPHGQEIPGRYDNFG